LNHGWPHRVGAALVLLALGALLGLHASSAFAQQVPGPVAAPAAPAAPAPAGGGGAPGDYYYRWGFFTLDQLAYKTHPFTQITGNGNFGKASTGSSLIFGAHQSDSSSDGFTQTLHSLPAFYLEAGKPVDLFLPKAISIGIDYYSFSQDASQAGTHGSVPDIRMDLWLYQIGLRAFAFDPNQPGFNYFGGIGFGILQGKLTAPGLKSSSIDFSQIGTGAVLFGLEAKGDNFGLRYEIDLFSASQVSLASNPYPGAAPNKIDFSGSLTRLAVFYQF
jgi:hypothetical protein